MDDRYMPVVWWSALLLLTAWFCVNGSSLERSAAFLQEQNDSMVTQKIYGHVRETGSYNPVIPMRVLKLQPRSALPEAEYETLLRIVEAEAGSEDENGKLLVANVVLNRVRSEAFPDTVTRVVYQESEGKAQFSPVSNGSIQNVTISPQTVQAVDRALGGEDLSQGALYFVSRQAADPQNMDWFDSHLTRLFSYGGHEFFR